MKLLHTRRHELYHFPDSKTPQYALLSYAEAIEENNPETYRVRPRSDEPWPHITAMVVRACDEAQKQGYDYIWIRSVCVDPSSPADLDEAINGARRRLEGAAACMAFLHDLQSDGPQYSEDDWGTCAYWTHAWTLPDLVIPKSVQFYDCKWKRQGSKNATQVMTIIQSVTGVPKAVLHDSSGLWDLSAACRLSWAAGRYAAQQEDVAYMLAPIMGVSMSTRYGEGLEAAFFRVQEAVMNNCRDGSIFAWCSSGKEKARGLLARSPSEFCAFARASTKNLQTHWIFDGLIRISSKGIEVQSRLANSDGFILLEIGRRGGDSWTSERIGIWVQEINGQHLRVMPGSVVRVAGLGTACSIHMTRNIDAHKAREVDEFLRNGPPRNQPYRDPLTQVVVEDLELDTARLTRCEPPSYPLTGMKRDWAGQSTDDQDQGRGPSSSAKRTRGSRTEPIDLVDGYEDSDESSDSIDTDLDMDLVPGGDQLLGPVPTPEEDDALLSNTEHYGLRTELTHLCYTMMNQWLKTAESAPTNARIVPRRRPRRRRNRAQAELDDDDDDDDDESDGAFGPDIELEASVNLGTPLRLCCPYYVNNPDAHRRCLLDHSLKSIPQVIKHLRKSHWQPPYCPRCSDTFADQRDLDEHIRDEVCDREAFVEFDGIDARKLAEVKKRDDPRIAKDSRWRLIYSTVFPRARLRRSPYLREDIEPTVARVQDYWLIAGSRFVSEYLESKGLSANMGGEDGKVFRALKRLALEDLVEQAAKLQLVQKESS